MSTKYPTISITTENDPKSESSEDESSSHDNDMNYNLNSDAATDIEDFNSHSGDMDNLTQRSRKLSSSGNIVEPVAKIHKDDDVTDVEDYNDSDNDDEEEKSKVYPELKLSLQEFLQHGLQEQATANNGIKEKVEIKAGNFLQAQNLNGVNDYLTDCEDYDTDSDIEWCCEKSVCVDLGTAVDDQGKVCIADAARDNISREESNENDDVSVFSDVSDMASALSDATGIGERGISEVEVLEMSAAEEVCQIAYSGSSESDEDEHFAKFVTNVAKLPAIDVTFVTADQQHSHKISPTIMTNSSSFLEISGARNEEVLTDIEGLEDSAAEDGSLGSENESDKPIPQAVILSSGDDACCQTDIEDIFCEDSSSCMSNVPSVAANMLPLPHREIVVLKEDKFGDTITSVEPMNNEYQFGIYYNKNDVPTDTEDFSFGEGFDRSPSIVEELLPTSNLIEREFIVSNEVFKPAMNKRIELHSNAESITDIEEIYLAGTNRRKKVKTRSSANNKSQKNKFLDVSRGGEEGITDVEDMDLSESDLPSNLITKNNDPQPRMNATTDEKVTDVEDITADDSISDASGQDIQPPHVDIDTDGLKEYIRNSANMILTLEIDASSTRKCPKHAKMGVHALQLNKFQDDDSGTSQQHTDVEDIQMPSDNEDASDIALGNNENNCTCGELNDMLNEIYTVVHEKSSNAFNIDSEKLHIKDRHETPDAHTDVEYMESDEPNGRGEKIQDSDHAIIQETTVYDVSYIHGKGDDDYEGDDDLNQKHLMHDDGLIDDNNDKADHHDDGEGDGDGNGDDDNDSDDDGDKYYDDDNSDDNNLSENTNDLHRKAKILVDKVLEESVQIVSDQQEQHQQHQQQRLLSFNQRQNIDAENGFEFNKNDYNSESENYAITCDDIGGLEVVKSPTIESMSGKSFDDNMSFTDEHMHLSQHSQVLALSTTSITSTTSTTINTTNSTTTTTTIMTTSVDFPSHALPEITEFTTMKTTTSLQEHHEQQYDSDSESDVQIATLATKKPPTSTLFESITGATDATMAKEIDNSDEAAVAVKARRIDRKFEKLSATVQDFNAEATVFDDNFVELVHEDELSALQSDFSKLSWDDSVSPTTNTLGEIGQNTPDNDEQDLNAGGECPKALEITPVPPPDVTCPDAPTPRPRSVKVPSPTTDSSDTEPRKSQDENLKLIQDTTQDIKDLEMIGDVSAPVPKPRVQSLKPNDSFKSLTALAAEYSDSVSLRSLDFTDDLSKTEEPSTTEYSIKSQQRDFPTTGTTTTATTATTTAASEDRSESFEPTSEISLDDGIESKRAADKTTSFYIGESSRNIITKSTRGSNEALTDIQSASADIEAKDITLMKEISVDSDEVADAFKEYVTIKEDQSAHKIIRQGSETRHDVLEDVVSGTQAKDTKETISSISGSQEESSMKTSTISNISAPPDMIQSLGDDMDDSIKDLSDAVYFDESKVLKEAVFEENTDLFDMKSETPLEKSEWEVSEKDIPMLKSKVVHSPQEVQPPIMKTIPDTDADEAIEKTTVEEEQKSLDAAKDTVKSVIQDATSIEESPSQFEFRILSQEHTVLSSDGDKASSPDVYGSEDTDISSFIGIPEREIKKDQKSSETPIKQQLQEQPNEGLFEGTITETLNKVAVMAHYAQNVFDDLKRDTKDDHGSLGFISTGTGEDYSLTEGAVAKEEHASLGFISNETAEDFSSMEDYYQEKFVKATIVSEEHEPSQPSPLGMGAVEPEFSDKPVDTVIHRVKAECSADPSNRWSIPEVDQSSSSESYYKSFEKTESRPLSSDVDNLLTHPNSSEYQTAVDMSSVIREGTDYMSAKSVFESSSGKTLSSRESMKSLDSQSETSANLGSIDVSELSETLVASSTDADALEAEELAQLGELRADDEDSEESIEIPGSTSGISSAMKRSQEMIFKPKSDEIEEKHIETVEIEEYPKPKEVERAWGYAYPLEESRTEDLKEAEKPEDVLLYHGEMRRSIDETKLASSLDEGSILSVSMSSTSNIDTVVENFEDMIGSAGSSSLTGIEGFGFAHEEQVSSLPEETFVLEMESKEGSPEESTATTPPGDNRKRGHKRNESTSISGETIKNATDRDLPIVGEGKESESESDTDPYESEYARQFRSPNERKPKKKKQAAAEMDHDIELEKRPFTPSQLVAEVIIEDAVTEELEAEAAMIEERRPSQNMQDYSKIPDIMVTEDVAKESSIKEEDASKFGEKTLYKVKTQEELHKAGDVPLHQDTVTDTKEESFQKLVQEQYKQKLAELKRVQVGVCDYDDEKAPDSPDSFEMVEQPDISDEFVIIEEVAKEAGEVDLGGKSIKIQPSKHESQHDEEVEKIIIRSAPADPKLGSQIIRDDLNFEFEESPPTAGSSSDQQEESDSGDMSGTNKRWVEMQLTDTQLRYPYDITSGMLEDIKEEDGEFEVGSSRISSFKDSFSSTPEYDVMAARRYYARGEHDDVSMSSLQEFESLEQAISLENRNKTHQGSTDSSNGSFTRRYMVRHSGSGTAQGDDISLSSLKEFEGLENACIEAHMIEIKAKEEAALLSRSDESNKSNGSDIENGASNIVVTKVTRTITRTEVPVGQQQQNIEALLKQKLKECENKGETVKITEVTDHLEPKVKIESQDSEKGSVDSLEINKSGDIMTSSIDSFDISKDATTRSEIDSLETDRKHPTREESIESIENEQIELISKFVAGGTTFGEGLTTTATTTTTSTDADGREHTVTRVVTTTTMVSSGGSGGSGTTTALELPSETIPKDASVDSLNMCIDQTTSSAGTTATYQTSAGDSQMSGSVTSCASSTLMEDSYPSTLIEGDTTILGNITTGTTNSSTSSTTTTTTTTTMTKK